MKLIMKYKTLREMLESINMWKSDYQLALPQTIEQLPQIILKFFKDANLDYTLYYDSKVNKLWNEYIVPNNYRQKIVGYLNEDELEELYQMWISDLSTIITDTYTKYSKLIDYYQNNIDKLMDPLMSITELNDTPQEILDIDDTESYVSTRQTTKTESQDRINRLNQLRYKLIDVYNEWSREFNKLFIVGAYYD